MLPWGIPPLHFLLSRGYSFHGQVSSLMSKVPPPFTDYWIKITRIFYSLCFIIRFFTVLSLGLQMDLGNTQNWFVLPTRRYRKPRHLFWTQLNRLQWGLGPYLQLLTMAPGMEKTQWPYSTHAFKSCAKYMETTCLSRLFMKISLSMISSLCFFVCKVRSLNSVNNFNINHFLSFTAFWAILNTYKTTKYQGDNKKP